MKIGAMRMDCCVQTVAAVASVGRQRGDHFSLANVAIHLEHLAFLAMAGEREGDHASLGRSSTRVTLALKQSRIRLVYALISPTFSRGLAVRTDSVRAVPSV